MTLLRKNARPNKLNPPNLLKWLSKKGKSASVRFLFIGATGIVVLGIFVFVVFAALVSRNLPNPDSLITRDIAQTTKIYDRTGTKLLYEVHGDKKRTLVKIEDIPDAVKNATIAIEDKRFYQHRGIYWKGIGRAFFLRITFQRSRLQGASTLTQQLAKNVFLSNERTFLRKIKEFVLALQIERHYTKEQILQMYLNEIPYGSNLYGIESAAQSYFGKSVKDLSLDEGALLTALPQAPDYYSPYGTGSRGDHRTKLIKRQHAIYDLMAEQGYLDRKDADAAKQIDTIKKLKPRNLGEISAPHFVMYVRELLIEKYGAKTVTEGGLKIITTLDLEKQKIAEEEVKKGVDARGRKHKFHNAALVSLDPKNGHILAMVGSKDFFDTENDGQFNVTLSPRQPGSSFKPIVYAVGFQQGYLPQTELWDVNTTFHSSSKPYAPHDYDGKERGPISIRSALQMSLNIPAVKMLYLVGVGRVLDFAESLGYTTFNQRGRFGLALVLGGGEVKPLEHAMAFATIANDGVAFPTTAVLRVEDAVGNVLEEWKTPARRRVLEPQIARLVSNVLSDNAARTPMFGAQNSLMLSDRPVASKTGTTNDYHDAWTVGYTPNLVSVVWVGNNDNTPMKSGADGSVVAAPIWQGYMRRAVKTLPVENFPEPNPPETTKPAILGLATKQVVKMDKVSGKRATDRTPTEFVEEKISFSPHTILTYVDKDDPLGALPDNPANDPQFEPWEQSIQDWVKRTGWHATDTIPLVYDDIHTEENQPRVSFVFPSQDQSVYQRSLFVELNIRAPRSVIKAEIQLDGSPLGNILNSPWQNTFLLPNSVSRGRHEVTALVTDDVGNKGTFSVAINLQAERASMDDITITSPAPDTIWSRASFPKIISLDLVDPTQYAKIEFVLIQETGERLLIASEPNPTSAMIHTTLYAGTAVGRQRLEVTGWKKDPAEPPDRAETTIVVVE